MKEIYLLKIFDSRIPLKVIGPQKSLAPLLPLIRVYFEGSWN